MLINGLRWGLTGLVLVWWFPVPKKYLKKLLLISFVGCTVQYSLTFSGLNIIDASSAVLFVQFEVPFAILIAYFFLKERPSKKNLLGLLIAFAGVVILSGAPNLLGKAMGVFLVLSGAFTWAAGQIIAKPVSEKLNGIILTAWIGTVSYTHLTLPTNREV